MIEAKNICKKFDEVDAIKDFNCKIPDGCIYGMLGANGAGKSTFLRLITGVYKPDSGCVMLDGEDIYDNPNAKKRMVYISDELFYLKGANLKRMSQMYETTYNSFDREMFKKMIKEFNLPINRSIDKFSKGMKRQACIILALSVKPDYYVFDETFDGLDPIVRGYVKSLICKEVAERKATVIITSHSLRELENLCDELAFLYKGGVILEHNIDDLKETQFKIQGVFNEDFDRNSLKSCEVLHFSKLGSVATIICNGELSKVEKELEEKQPMFYDIIPMSLDEIFIYKMKKQGYSYDNFWED